MGQSETMEASKAPGLDGIDSAIAKPLANVLVKPRSQLFSASLDERPLLMDWLTSTVLPVHKVWDRNNCGGCGLVSHISIMMKT